MHISHSLPGKFPSRNRSTMFISRLEGWKEELVRRLSLHLPSLLSPKPQFSHHHVDFQPSPGPGTGRNRSISWQMVSHATTYDVSLISRHRLVAEILALFHRRMGVLETPIHPCYIDLHPCAVSGVESTNDTVVTFV